MMSSIVTPAGASRAVTSSPGASSAKPSTSKPHATFDTVAGANAVTTASIRALILPAVTTKTQKHQDAPGRSDRPCVSLWLRDFVVPLAMVPLANRRDQVLVEGALEVVGGIEAPVAARRRIVNRRRPRIDDPLSLRVDLVADVRIGERRDH